MIRKMSTCPIVLIAVALAACPAMLIPRPQSRSASIASA
jgi:hypothetical protein